eukprot:10789925-Alexandrium_andersonii.AAC.1
METSAYTYTQARAYARAAHLHLPIRLAVTFGTRLSARPRASSGCSGWSWHPSLPQPHMRQDSLEFRIMPMEAERAEPCWNRLSAPICVGSSAYSWSPANVGVQP